MQTINDTIIQALDIADLPHDMQEDVIARAGEGIMQSVMIHAFMTLSLQDQHTLMEYLDQDKSVDDIFAWLKEKMPEFPEVVADALAKYVLA